MTYAPSAVPSASSRIHDGLGHPVIDADGHTIEFMPLLDDYLAEYVGPKAVDEYHRSSLWFSADEETRQRQRLPKPVWGYPTHPLDAVTSVLPALVEERLGEMGIDFSVIYPSPARLGVPHLDDDALRVGMCRALNAYQSDLFAPHQAHLTPAALIPMHNPTEAIEELEFAVGRLGMKAIQMPSFIQRRFGPDAGAKAGQIWWDNLVIDSAHDYDPVWAKCRELRVPPGFHSGTLGFGSRTTPSNSIYNHLGHFAVGQEAICKALVLGGVTARFRDLKFAFLESGVGWAAMLFSDLLDHWHKRNTEAVRKYDPERLDYDLARELVGRYGGARMAAHADEAAAIRDRMTWLEERDFSRHFDEFAVADIRTDEDLYERFVPNFYFGCEGEDRMNALAFQPRLLPFGAELKPVYGSDISHMSVPDMREVLEEAYELVEEGFVTAEQFQKMTFGNPVELLAGMNPDFFSGTAVEAAVAAELAASPAAAE